MLPESAAGLTAEHGEAGRISDLLDGRVDSQITPQARQFLDALDVLGVPLFAGPDDYSGNRGWQNYTADGNAARLAVARPGHCFMALCGGALTVVDVDPRNFPESERWHAVDTVRQLLSDLGVRIFAEVETGSGGAHFYIAGHRDHRTVHGFLGWPGVDVQAAGANVFVPGSLREKHGGRGYRIAFDDLAALADGGDPDGAENFAGWLAERTAKRHADTGPAAPPWTGDRRVTPYLRKVLENTLSELGAAVAGTFNDTLNTKAFKLGQLVAGAGLPEVDARHALEAGCTANDGRAPDRGSLATIRSGLRAGALLPKAVPESDALTFSGNLAALNGHPAPVGSILPATNHDAATEPTEAVSGGLAELLTPGGAFILDAPDHVPALWGDGAVVLWAEGEALILAGPPGVGKTTLVGQVVSARLGIGGAVLGLPIKPTGTKVLYLAMDRPKQIARSLRRTLGQAPRKALNDTLIVWQGPPPADLAKRPEMLLELARKAGADTVIVDSLKDAAIGLTDDEVGAGYNRARQLCLANGVEVIELHHIVKRGANGTKPNTLADVYGSAWITAGAGSVLLLWGEAGDPVVEAIHLKQPADPFGPCKVIHDHDAGISTLFEPTDMVAVVRAAGPDGITAKAAAAVMFDTDNASAAQVEKARRKLDRLPVLTRSDGSRQANKPAVWTFTRTFTQDQQPSTITTPSRPSRATTLPQVSDHHAHPHDHHADPPSRTAPPLYRGAVRVGEGNDHENPLRSLSMCSCGNIAEAGSETCWKCA